VVVQPNDVVRDLGVLLDSELSLKEHVNRTASTCSYHLRRLRQLKRHVNIEVMKRLISAFVFSQLDYCNSILSGLPLSTIAPLQRVQNAAACPWLVPERSRASCPEGVALVASGVPNQVQACTGDVHDPHTSVPRLPDRFCTPLQQQ